VAEPLKNLYNELYIKRLCLALNVVHPSFTAESFVNAIFNDSWSKKELKERMRHIATTLKPFLTQSYSQNIEILKRVFLKMDYNYALENMLFQDFVEVYGMDDFETSMQALEHFTINSSSEFAIRRFIVKYPALTMQQMKLWAKSDNEHIRRLATEGCRPRLPWAIALPSFKRNPSEVLEILELLKDDKSAYVRKSVANNINDISKENPNMVIELTKQWITKNKNRDTLLKHGCRTLLKESNQEVLELFGFSKVKNLEFKDFVVPKELKIGEELEFSFELNSPKSLGKLRVEFVMHFLRKNSQHNRKVFKLAEGVYKKSSKKFIKSYSFRPISTRVYYKGLQKISIVINGEEFEQKRFSLV